MDDMTGAELRRPRRAAEDKSTGSAAAHETGRHSGTVR